MLYKLIIFYRVSTINILANIEVKIFSIREGINIEKTIRDRNCEFRIIPGSIKVYTAKYVNP